MRISARGLLALKISVMVAYFLFWNALVLSAWTINGDAALSVPEAFWLIAIATLTTTTLAVAILSSARARGVLFAPKRASCYEPAPYALIAVVTLIMGLASLGSALRIW